MGKILVSEKESLLPAPPTPGVQRETALQGENFVILHSTAEGGVTSGWHHHGEHEVFG